MARAAPRSASGLARVRRVPTLAPSMKKLLFAAVLSLGLVSLLAGCGNSARPLAGLALELTSVEQTADGAVNVTVRVVNPNMVAYNIASATHRVYLQDRLVGTMKINSPTGVPAQMGIDQTGPLQLERGAQLPNGSVRYRLDSMLVMRLWGDNTKTHKLSAVGTIAISGQ